MPFGSAPGPHEGYQPLLAERIHQADGLVAGLFGRMEELSIRYQEERGTLEKRDVTRLTIMALREMAKGRGPTPWEFSTSELTAQITSSRETRTSVRRIATAGAARTSPTVFASDGSWNVSVSTAARPRCSQENLGCRPRRRREAVQDLRHGAAVPDGSRCRTTARHTRLIRHGF